VVEEVVPTTDILTPEPAGVPPEDSRESLVRHAAVMSVGTALSRLTGFLRLSATTYAIGVTVSPLADTYAKANTTPNIVYELVLGGILTSVFVPVFVEWLQRHGADEASAVADRVLTLTLVSLTAIAALGALFAPQIIRLYLVASDAPDRQSQIELGAFFLRWFMPQIVFYGVGAVATGLLNAHRRFAAPMFAPILNNLVVVATFLAYASIAGDDRVSVGGISLGEKLLLGAGTTLGVVAMTVALGPSLRSLGLRWRPRFDWNHPAVRRLGRLAVWVVVYVVANQVAYLLVIILSGPFQGGYAAYAAAFILFQLPHAIFAVSIFTSLLPGMSGRWTDRDTVGARTLLSQGVRDTALVIVPAAAGYLLLAVPITRLLLEHGRAGPADTELIASTLRAFAIGLPFFSTFQLLTRTFYAMQDTRTPALVNVAAACVNVAANLVYLEVFDLEVAGLALGHATSYAFATTVCLVVLRRRLGGIDGRRIGATIGRIVPAAALTGLSAALASSLVQRWLDETRLGVQLVQVLAAVVVGLLVFAACALIFRIREVEEVRVAVMRRFRG
jgi:putative peptidoglycan lipid II flippase